MFGQNWKPLVPLEGKARDGLEAFRTGRLMLATHGNRSWDLDANAAVIFKELDCFMRKQTRKPNPAQTVRNEK